MLPQVIDDNHFSFTNPIGKTMELENPGYLELDGAAENGTWTPRVAAGKYAYNPILHTYGNHLHLTSRAKELERYRREMIEMVRDLPEVAYELSLKDLVELPSMEFPSTVKSGEGMRKNEKDCREKKQEMKLRTCKQMASSESLGSGGFLLKMFFFPTSCSGKRRRSPGAARIGTRVSPKPVLADGEKNRAGKPKPSDVKCLNDEEDSHGEFSRSGSGDSTSSSSGDSTSSSCRRKKSGWYSFLHSSKGKSRDIEGAGF